ncbi:MBL fold metallo-hydrolase [Azospirillaceae bacterium]
MRCFTLYGKNRHRWLTFGRDPARNNNVVDTNQVVICSDRSVILLDPGGMEIFPAMMAALVHEIDMEAVKHIFLSHQDPDVGSALSLWRQVAAPNAAIYAPALWLPYIAHFDAAAKFTPVPDEGLDIELAPQVTLRLLPAHYMHSSAAFCVYDPQARMLFSSDIGAADAPPEMTKDIWLDNFSAYTPFLEIFHKRYLGSPAARDAWVEMVSRLPIDCIIPQHGLAFRGDNVKKFLNWLHALSIATGLEAYKSRSARLA